MCCASRLRARETTEHPQMEHVADPCELISERRADEPAGDRHEDRLRRDEAREHAAV